MQKGKLLIFISLLILAIALIGCDNKEIIIAKTEDIPQETPLEVIKSARTNSNNLFAVKQKIKTENSGNVDGIENVEATVIYEFDTNKGYVEMESEGELIAILIDNDKLYVKDGNTDKYVDFSNSILGKILLSNINFAEINENYRQLDDSMINLFKDENITVEDDEITVNGKPEKVKKITAVIPREQTTEILSKYMKTMIEYAMDTTLNELVEFQAKMQESITGEAINEEEKNKIKETLTAELQKQIQEQLQKMNFSDIKSVYYIKDNIILKYEVSYSITVDGETSNIKTTCEIIEYGEHVKCPKISEEDVISFEEYLNLK